MQFNKVEFGNRLFIARNNKMLKQSDVGKAIGINQSTYSKVETGKLDIPISNLFILSEFLDVSVLWLLGFSDEAYTQDELMQIENFKGHIISIRKKQ